MKLGGVLFMCFVLIGLSKQAFLHEPLNATLEYNNLKSGAIIIWDKLTVLITQLTYRPQWFTKHENLCFVGIVPATPTDIFVKLQFDNEHEYHDACINDNFYIGRQIVLKVPTTTNFTVVDFKNIAVINNTDEIKTSVTIHSSDVDLKTKPTYNNLDFIVYPKCCKDDYYLHVDDMSCKEIEPHLEVQFERAERVPIHNIQAIEDGKIVQYETEILSCDYEPYYWPSSESLYSLDKNEFILTNTLELFKDKYLFGPIVCIDFIYDEEREEFQEFVFFYANKSVLLNVCNSLWVGLVLFLHGIIRTMLDC